MSINDAIPQDAVPRDLTAQQWMRAKAAEIAFERAGTRTYSASVAEVLLQADQILQYIETGHLPQQP